ncbi:MAG: hypothetical protein WCH65_05900 [bacterium]
MTPDRVGNVLSIVNVAPVLLPARSVIINVYTCSVENVVPLANGFPLMLAQEIFVSL